MVRWPCPLHQSKDIHPLNACKRTLRWRKPSVLPWPSTRYHHQWRLPRTLWRIQRINDITDRQTCRRCLPKQHRGKLLREQQNNRRWRRTSIRRILSRPIQVYPISIWLVLRRHKKLEDTGNSTLHLSMTNLQENNYMFSQLIGWTSTPGTSNLLTQQ